MGRVPPPVVLLQLWYTDFVRKVWKAEKPARKNSSRKGGKTRYQRGWYWRRRSMQWWGSHGSFPFSFPGFKSTLPLSRNPEGKQWALILPARQGATSPPEPGRSEEREGCNFILLLLASVSLAHYGSPFCSCKMLLNSVAVYMWWISSPCGRACSGAVLGLLRYTFHVSLIYHAGWLWGLIS